VEGRMVDKMKVLTPPLLCSGWINAQLISHTFRLPLRAHMNGSYGSAMLR